MFIGAARRSRLATLIYHRVVPEQDPLRPGEPTVAEFEWQMRLLRRHFTPLPLGEAVQRLAAGDLPPRAVCVTFDDGYADNAELALPVLQRHGIPATVFVSTGFLNGGRMWNDTVIEAVRRESSGVLDLSPIGLTELTLGSEAERLAAIEQILRTIKYETPRRRIEAVAELVGDDGALPQDLMMTDDQVRKLHAAGIEVGAHTVNHPILASISDEDARREIASSRDYLQSLLQSEVLSFAYPNGKPEHDYRQTHRDVCAELGFSRGVSTHWGAGIAASDPLQLPRFTPWDKTETRFALRLLLSYRNADPLVADS